MELKNYTPHAINFFRPEDATDMGRGVFQLCPGAVPVMSLASEGVARATVTEQACPAVPVSGIELPVFRMEYGQPVGLPDPVPGIGLVVSALTAQAAQRAGRSVDDLFMVAHTVRDSEGKIVGALGLSQL